MGNGIVTCDYCMTVTIAYIREERVRGKLEMISRSKLGNEDHKLVTFDYVQENKE